MDKYVDGFILLVSENMNDEYRKMAKDGRDTWMKHGALAYFECRGDDMVAREMGVEKCRSFPEMAGAKSDQTVWFSFIIFKSKEHRDEVNAKVMIEMGEAANEYVNVPMPFNMNQMAYGGFKVEVEG